MARPWMRLDIGSVRVQIGPRPRRREQVQDDAPQMVVDSQHPAVVWADPDIDETSLGFRLPRD